MLYSETLRLIPQSAAAAALSLLKSKFLSLFHSVTLGPKLVFVPLFFSVACCFVFWCATVGGVGKGHLQKKH